MPRSTQQPLPLRAKIGAVLALSPLLVPVLGSLWLYVWIASNNYQGSKTVGEAWFEYAVMYALYLGPAIILATIILTCVGVGLLLYRKN